MMIKTSPLPSREENSQAVENDSLRFNDSLSFQAQDPVKVISFHCWKKSFPI